MENLEFESAPKEKLASYEGLLKSSVRLGIFIAVVLLAMYFFLV